MPTHTWTHTLNRGVSPNPKLQTTIEADGEQPRKVTANGGTTNQQILIAFTLTNLKSILITATGTCTLKTNSTSAPDDTFALDSDSGVVWNNQMAAAIPFAANVTTMYLTVPSGDPVTVEIDALFDSTP